MMKRCLIAVALVASVVLPAQVDAGAAPAAAEHCVVHVTGQEASGELIVSTPRCYPTFAEAMSEEQVSAWGVGASERAGGSDVGALSFTLATHYDYTGFNPAGGTTSTVGTGCTGGWLNTSGAWNDRIGSTRNGCPTVIHFDLTGLGGSSAATTGTGGNLGTMNNRTSSIQYT